MKLKYLIIIFRGALFSILALGLVGHAAETKPSSLDEALRAGNIQDVLKILGPGDSESESMEPTVPASRPPKDRDKRHRITLVSGDGTVRDLSRSSREVVPRAARPEKAPPPVVATEPTSTVTTVTVEAAPSSDTVSQPRRALPAAQPVQVPLTRPRRGVAKPVKSDEKQAPAEDTKPRVTTVSVPTGPAEAPEDRELASKELANLLKQVGASEPDVEPTTVTPAMSSASTTVTPPAVLDEDRKISKPLGEASRTGTTTVPRTSVTVVQPTTRQPASTVSSVTGMDDPMRTTRRQLDRLLQEAKQETFGSASVSPTIGTASRVGGKSDGGWRYEGRWVEGRMDGEGVLTYPDGWRYEGEWRENVMMGQGTLFHPDGWQYTGEWRGGKMDGHGTLIYPDGWKYVGEWRDGKMHGKGELIHPRNLATQTSR